MMFEIVNSKLSKRTKILIYISVFFGISGMLSGLVLDEASNHISIIAIGLCFIVLLYLSISSFVHPDYQLIGKVEFGKMSINVLFNSSMLNFDYINITNISLYYNSFNGEPAIYGLGINRGNKNFLQISIEDKIYEYDILLRNQTQKKFLFDQLELLSKKGISANIYLAKRGKVVKPNPNTL